VFIKMQIVKGDFMVEKLLMMRTLALFRIFSCQSLSVFCEHNENGQIQYVSNFVWLINSDKQFLY
jgi:hypothetical protein